MFLYFKSSFYFVQPNGPEDRLSKGNKNVPSGRSLALEYIKIGH